MASHKEIRCADRHVSTKKPETWKKRLEVANNLDTAIANKFSDFSQRSSRKVLADLTPANGQLTSDDLKKIVQLGHRHSLTTKFVLRMRDPLARVTSATTQVLKRRALEQGEDYYKFMREADPNSFLRDPTNCETILRRTDYEKTIKSVRAIADQDNILNLFVEDDGFTQNGIDQISSFLGIQPVSALNRAANPSEVKTELDEETQKWVVNQLRPVYEFVRQEFGPKIDRLWQYSMRLLD
tara:strand:+ start:65 stop:784 length:720 start_codon:yes stop_codon:yes gene_type:complete